MAQYAEGVEAHAVKTWTFTCPACKAASPFRVNQHTPKLVASSKSLFSGMVQQTLGVECPKCRVFTPLTMEVGDAAISV